MQVKEIFQFKESVGNIDSKRLTKRGFNWISYSGLLFFSTKFRKSCLNHAIFDRFIEYKEEISIKEVSETSVQRYIWVLEAWSSVGNNILDFLFFRPNLASSVQNQVIFNRFVKFISEENVVVVIRHGYYRPFGRVEPFVFRLNFDVELVSKIEVSATKSTTIILGWS